MIKRVIVIAVLLIYSAFLECPLRGQIKPFTRHAGECHITANKSEATPRATRGRRGLRGRRRRQQRSSSHAHKTHVPLRSSSGRARRASSVDALSAVRAAAFRCRGASVRDLRPAVDASASQEPLFTWFQERESNPRQAESICCSTSELSWSPKIATRAVHANGTAAARQCGS
jgi:hypothetical protein